MRSPAPAAPTVLAPAARLLWRTQTCVQVELGGRRVLVDGIDPAAVGELVGRPRPDARCCDTPPVGDVAQQLIGTGFLWSGTDPDAPDERLVAPQRRLRPELLALTARYGDGAADVLHGRRCAAIVIEGTGRVVPYLAALLAGCGIGAVCAVDRRPTTTAHALPGGSLLTEESHPLAEVTARAVARAAPEADTRAPALGDRPDLVILATDEPVDPERRAGLHAQGVAHLLVATPVDHAVVGPLVLPGLTSCLGCADLHRLDRDPAWNALAVQLSVRPRVAATADAALTAMAAALTAMEALAFLDGAQPATVEGSLEIHAGDRRIRRRSWPLHPDCPCIVS